MKRLQARAWLLFSILWETCIATPPLALHQLVEVEEGGEVVLSLYGFDVDGDGVSYLILGNLGRVAHLHDSSFISVL
jgi:hypothetical protein